MSGRFWIEAVMAAVVALGVSTWGTQSTAPAVLSEPASGFYAEMAAVHLEEGPDAVGLSENAPALAPSGAGDPLWSCGGWQGPTSFQRALLDGSVSPQRSTEHGAASEPMVYAYAGEAGGI
ncbi:MAG: hypothetical protein IT364_04145 [Candidatus Hydrogenedentes bacterium]|nr:hypothetical protein [Candidatus Hydrogenedentota bacterium]